MYPFLNSSGNHSVRSRISFFRLAALVFALAGWSILTERCAQARPRLPSVPGSSSSLEGLPMSTAADSQEILTLSEAASLLRASPEDIEQLATQQRLPGRRIGTQWRFSRTALLSWLARGEVQP